MMRNVVTIGNIKLGGNNPIVIQTMTTSKTSNISQTIKQINFFAKHGIKMVRVSVLDDNDVNALKKICQISPIPVIADIHYVAKYAINAIKNGVSKIRINPNNINNKNDIVKIIQYAKKHHVAIRIGINSGNFKFQKNIPVEQQLVKFTNK
jgi:(E)-4-hydroxy-3-methylbut-2-enyl-diphosphate synthase